MSLGLWVGPTTHLGSARPAPAPHPRAAHASTPNPRLHSALCVHAPRVHAPRVRAPRSHARAPRPHFAPHPGTSRPAPAPPAPRAPHLRPGVLRPHSHLAPASRIRVRTTSSARTAAPRVRVRRAPCGWRSARVPHLAACACIRAPTPSSGPHRRASRSAPRNLRLAPHACPRLAPAPAAPRAPRTLGLAPCTRARTSGPAPASAPRTPDLAPLSAFTFAPHPAPAPLRLTPALRTPRAPCRAPCASRPHACPAPWGLRPYRRPAPQPGTLRLHSAPCVRSPGTDHQAQSRT